MDGLWRDSTTASRSYATIARGVVTSRTHAAAPRPHTSSPSSAHVLEERRDVTDGLRLHQGRAGAHRLEQAVRRAQHGASLRVFGRRPPIDRQTQKLQGVRVCACREGVK